MGERTTTRTAFLSLALTVFLPRTLEAVDPWTATFVKMGDSELRKDSTRPTETFVYDRNTLTTGQATVSVSPSGSALAGKTDLDPVTFSPPLAVSLSVSLTYKNSIDRGTLTTLEARVYDGWTNETLCTAAPVTKSTPKDSTVGFGLDLACTLGTIRAFDSLGVKKTSVAVMFRLVDGAGALFYDVIGATYEHTFVTEMSPWAVSSAPGAFPEPLTATISGGNFVAGTKVAIGDVKVAATRVLSLSKMEVDLEGLGKLAEGPRDVEVTRPDGVKAKGTGTFVVSDLWVSDLEVNQGIPVGCTASMPCVADHATVVRAKVRCNLCTQKQRKVTGLLHVRKGGSPIPGSPFLAQPRQLTRVFREGSTDLGDLTLRAYAADDLDFPFEGTNALPEGSYDFELEMDPRKPDTVPPRLGFPDLRKSMAWRVMNRKLVRSARGLRIGVVVDTASLPAKPGPALRAQVDGVLSTFDFLRAAFPVSQDLVRAERVPCRAAVTSDDEEAVWPALDACHRLLVTNNPGDPFTHVVLFTNTLAFEGAGVSNCNGGYGYHCPSPVSIVRFLEQTTEATVAHELGHHLLLGDTYPPPNTENAAVNGRSHPLCTRFSDGCEVEDGHFDLLRREASVNDPDSSERRYVKRDLMGNADRAFRWIDGRSWAHLYRRFMGSAARPAEAAASRELVLVAGTVRADGTGTLDRIERFTGTVEVSQPPAGDYALDLLDKGGSVLSSTTFPIGFTYARDPGGSKPASRVPFSLTLALPPGAERFVLRKGGQQLASRSPSPSPPVVQLVAPEGGTALSGTVTVTWSASDPDGDPLAFDLLYSRDGASWLPIATSLGGTSATWETASVPGTKAGWLRVVASDGVNTAASTIARPFSIALKPPVVGITAPADGFVTTSGQPVTFASYGDDAEDGQLPDGALAVSSSRDGALGTGRAVFVQGLSEGLHTITVTGTDSEGARATASIELTVVAAPGAEPSGTAFVPIVLSSSGLADSFFTSELTLTNRGTKDAVVELTYVAAFGGAVGTAYDSLPAGRQKVIPDAIAYLAASGVPLPSTGNRGGTLSVGFFGLSAPGTGAATVRTTTRVPEGRAGLSYPGIVPGAITGPVYLCGLRQSGTDRSNVALVIAGSEADGGVSLRLTVTSGDPAAPRAQVLPDVTLPPGGFSQISQVLASNGLDLTNGYVKVERVGGTAPYHAYAVINDQSNSDGSFVPPVLAEALVGKTGLSLPVAVEAGPFTTELVVTNFGMAEKTVRLTYVASAIPKQGNEASITLTLAPREQRVFPSFVQALRELVPSIGPAGPTFVGAVFLTVPGGDVAGLFLGARTSAPGGGGRYGLFYTGVPGGSAATTSAWLHGLRQDEENRSNLAIVNTGEVDTSPSSFRIDLFDGDTGVLVKAVEGISVGARGFAQLSSILESHAPSTRNAYARVTRVSGSNPFLCYAVVNDGGKPGVRSDDGAFVTMASVDEAP